VRTATSQKASQCAFDVLTEYQVFLDLGVPGIQLHIEELRALARTNNPVAAV
jgi:hypothetical protein